MSVSFCVITWSRKTSSGRNQEFWNGHQPKVILEAGKDAYPDHTIVEIMTVRSSTLWRFSWYLRLPILLLWSTTLFQIALRQANDLQAHRQTRFQVILQYYAIAELRESKCPTWHTTSTRSIRVEARTKRSAPIWTINCYALGHNLALDSMPPSNS